MCAFQTLSGHIGLHFTLEEQKPGKNKAYLGVLVNLGLSGQQNIILSLVIPFQQTEVKGHMHPKAHVYRIYFSSS